MHCFYYISRQQVVNIKSLNNLTGCWSELFLRQFQTAIIFSGSRKRKVVRVHDPKAHPENNKGFRKNILKPLCLCALGHTFIKRRFCLFIIPAESITPVSCFFSWPLRQYRSGRYQAAARWRARERDRLHQRDDLQSTLHINRIV